jgi:hypothetical protein
MELGAAVLRPQSGAAKDQKILNFKELADENNQDNIAIYSNIVFPGPAADVRKR